MTGESVVGPKDGACVGACVVELADGILVGVVVGTKVGSDVTMHLTLHEHGHRETSVLASSKEKPTEAKRSQLNP